MEKRYQPGHSFIEYLNTIEALLQDKIASVDEQLLEQRQDAHFFSSIIE